MKTLAVLGAGGHGKVVADAAESSGWQHIDFYDDAWPSLTQCLTWPVVGSIKDFLQSAPEYDGVVVALGNNLVRETTLLALLQAQRPAVSVVHPQATVSRHAQLGPGSVVFAGAVVNPGAVVGKGAILNTGCGIDHDCVLGDAVHVSPGAHLGGNVSVGRLSWVGLGASVRQQIKIGQRVIVGAGAVVVSHVPDDHTVVGNPARDMVKEKIQGN